MKLLFRFFLELYSQTSEPFFKLIIFFFNSLISEIKFYTNIYARKCSKLKIDINCGNKGIRSLKLILIHIPNKFERDIKIFFKDITERCNTTFLEK